MLVELCNCLACAHLEGGLKPLEVPVNCETALVFIWAHPRIIRMFLWTRRQGLKAFLAVIDLRATTYI